MTTRKPIHFFLFFCTLVLGVSAFTFLPEQGRAQQTKQQQLWSSSSSTDNNIPWYSDPHLGKDRSHVLPANRGFDYVENGKTTILSSNLDTVIRKPTSKIIPFHESNVYVRRIEGEGMRGEVKPLYLSYDECDSSWFQNDNTLVWLGKKGADDIDYFAVNIPDAEAAVLTTSDNQTIESSTVRNYGDVMPSRTDAALVASANGLLSFHRSHGYCSNCGAPTKSIKAGSARKCINDDGSCRNRSVYHRIDPAVIMLVTCGEYALLGRKASWPSGRYSTLAGFLEVGETLEDCVVRETMEESSIRVRRESIRFVASQPWPFPRSMMVGFHATTTAIGDELPPIVVDPNELEDVQWFSKDFVRTQGLVDGKGSSALDFEPDEDESTFHIPGSASLARVLIREWVNE